jgi:hypothetical protein
MEAASGTQCLFLQELRRRSAPGLIVVCDKHTALDPPPKAQTLPADHNAFMPVLVACNRNQACPFTRDIRIALAKLKGTIFHTMSFRDIQLGTMLRVSAAVLFAKTKGKIAVEAISDRLAISVYRAFRPTFAEPDEVLDTAIVMEKIAAEPLRIPHLLFLVSSKEADPGGNLAEVDGYDSLRSHVPLELLAAIAARNGKKAAAKKGKLERVVTSSEESEGESDSDK